MKQIIISILFKYARPILVDLILDIVIPVLKKEAEKTDNNIDDKVIEIVEKAIKDGLN